MLTTRVCDPQASLEEELKRTERDHARARQALQGTLRELTLAIRQKEELIRTLIQSESEAAAAAQAFESRVQHLEAEVGKYRSTVSQVQAQLEEHDRALVASTQEAKEAQEALKRKCVAVTTSCCGARLSRALTFLLLLKFEMNLWQVPSEAGASQGQPRGSSATPGGSESSGERTSAWRETGGGFGV